MRKGLKKGFSSVLPHDYSDIYLGNSYLGERSILVNHQQWVDRRGVLFRVIPNGFGPFRMIPNTFCAIPNSFGPFRMIPNTLRVIPKNLHAITSTSIAKIRLFTRETSNFG